jgi:hypothetical protein
VLTVGASENLRPEQTSTWGAGWPDDFPVNPISSDRLADDADGMAAFSSRGPTDDGRIKPDVTAPGTMIISARSHDPDAGEGWGVYDGDYLYMGGTSMSTPLTAGGAALVREWLTRIKSVANPSGALMKAVLVNGAADMSPGQYTSPQEIPAARPNNVTGWGRVDLVGSLDPPSPRKVWFKDHTTGLSTGGDVEYTLSIGSSQARGQGEGETESQPISAPPRLSAAHPLVADERPVIPRTYPGVWREASSSPHCPLGTVELLQNRSFEDASGGTLDVWQDNSSGWYVNQTDTDAHSGTYSAFMGGYQGDPGLMLYQSMNFPADATAATLQVYLEGLSLGSDTIQAELWIENGATDILVDTHALSAANSTWTGNTWNLSSSAVNQLKGNQVWVVFYAMMATTDSFYLVDDASLAVTTGGGTTASLTITPASGPRGTVFHVTGSNFDPNDTVTIAIDGADQSTVPSDGSGGFSFNLTPPGTETKGVHTVTATDTGGHSANDTYEIVPQVSVDVSPASGDPGDSFTVTGSGFHGGSAITVKLDGATDGTATANTGGGFTYNLNTGAGIAAGSHAVSATDDEDSTGNDTFTIGGGACPEALNDGGFEASTGDTSNPHWTVSGNARFTVNQGIARTGEDAAILGYTSGPPDTGDLWQAVSVSADASSATLSFWYQTMGDGSFTVDVDVTDSSGSTVLVHLTTLTSATYDWQQYNHSFTSGELASIAGQNTRLRFRISGSSIPEDVVIDDVSWQICTGGAPPQTGGPFRFTLAWTDYPGTPGAAKALVNDLDLEIIGPDGTHYYGNAGLYTSGQCLRSGKWDACNNVEGIIIPDASYGTYTVIVHGYNVAQGPQPFALVASGDNLREGSGPPPTYDNFVYLPLVLRQ